MMLDDNKQISAEMVADYLNQNRGFFQVFPSLVDDLSMPHPKTGDTISLLEHQVLHLRQQRDALQIEVDALKNIAGENGVLLQKVYELAQILMQAPTEQTAVDAIYKEMIRLFLVEHISLMSWTVPKTRIDKIHQLGFSQDWVRLLKNHLAVNQPVCGPLENDWRRGLFPATEDVESVCILPLGQNKVWGVLALGATSDRFSPGLGTYFLKMMARLITARLERLFENG